MPYEYGWRIQPSPCAPSHRFKACQTRQVPAVCELCPPPPPNSYGEALTANGTYLDIGPYPRKERKWRRDRKGQINRGRARERKRKSDSVRTREKTERERDEEPGTKGDRKSYRQSKSCREMGRAGPSGSPSPPSTAPHLGVGGSIDHLSLPQPDDGGCRLGVVCMAGEVEGVPGPQADDRPPQDDGVVRWHCGERRGEVRLRAPLPSGRAGWTL